MNFPVRVSLLRAGLLRLTGWPGFAAIAAISLALLPALVSSARAATEASPLAADLVITNGHVVTMNERREVHASGAVVIQGSRLLAVGPAEIATRYRAARVIDARGGLVLPGFVNAHTHASMTVFRGLGDDVPDRLRRFIFPLEKALVDRELVYWGALHGLVEMIEGGVTTFADMYYFEEEVARAAKHAGLRAVLGQTVVNFPAPDARPIISWTWARAMRSSCSSSR